MLLFYAMYAVVALLGVFLGSVIVDRIISHKKWS